MSRVKEKKMKKEKKIWYKTWMGYCLTELKAGLGAGLGTGRAGEVRGTAQAAWARGRKVSGRMGAGRVGRAGTLALGARGEQAHGRWARRASGARTAGGHWAGARQAGTPCRRARPAGARHRRAVGRHAGRSRRTRHGRLGGLSAAWACGWANGLCTWCTQPVLTLFDLVFFLSR